MAVALLVERGADVESWTYASPLPAALGTAQHGAAYYGRKEGVRCLLHEGADPSIRDRAFERTRAGWAGYAGFPEIEELPSVGETRGTQ